MKDASDIPEFLKYMLGMNGEQNPHSSKWICDPCGRNLGNHRGHASTYHAGKCDYCEQDQYVTENRDYGVE